jgi:hypothetical protein
MFQWLTPASPGGKYGENDGARFAYGVPGEDAQGKLRVDSDAVAAWLDCPLP